MFSVNVWPASLSLHLLPGILFLTTTESVKLSSLKFLAIIATGIYYRNLLQEYTW